MFNFTLARPISKIEKWLYLQIFVLLKQHWDSHSPPLIIVSGLSMLRHFGHLYWLHSLATWPFMNKCRTAARFLGPIVSQWMGNQSSNEGNQLIWNVMSADSHFWGPIVRPLWHEPFSEFMPSQEKEKEEEEGEGEGAKSEKCDTEIDWDDDDDVDEPGENSSESPRYSGLTCSALWGGDHHKLGALSGYIYSYSSLWSKKMQETLH